VGEPSPHLSLYSYLSTLVRGAPSSAFLEVRFRVGEQAMASEFFPAHAHEDQSAAIRSRARGTDVYVGCAPRSRRAGTKDAVGDVWVLWAECDGAAAARAAHAHDPRPSMIVASGSGPNLHAYWPLREPLRPQDAEAANLRLAHALGADVACFDASRILRPPGTWNHKRQPPRPVALLRLEQGVAFDAADVIARTPPIDIQRLEHRWNPRPDRRPACDGLLHLTPDSYVTALIGRPPNAEHKVHCPFHHDERPSLHVYRTAARGWYCYSCGRGGSIYDLAAGLWGLGTRGTDFVELKRRLESVFARELFASRDLAR
jgi:hypothetical protein